MRIARWFFYLISHLFCFIILAIILIEAIFCIFNITDFKLMIAITITIILLSLIASIIVTILLNKSASQKLSDKLGRTYQKAKHPDKYKSIINFVHEVTNSKSYFFIRNSLIAELKSKISVVNITTMLSIVFAILLSLNELATFIKLILIIASGSVTLLIMFFQCEYTYLLSALEDFPNEHDQFIKMYNQVNNKIVSPSVPHPVTTGTFDVCVVNNDDNSVINYCIHVKKENSNLL